jgi:hypothetical protein
MDASERATTEASTKTINAISPSAHKFNQLFEKYMGQELWVWIEDGALSMSDGELDSRLVQLGIKTGAIEVTSVLGSTAFLRVKSAYEPLQPSQGASTTSLNAQVMP